LVRYFALLLSLQVIPIWFNQDPRVFRGMVGLLYEGTNKELSTTSTDLKKGFDVV
jgi:hypothetical protein